MKKTLLFIGTVLMSISSFAQNPGLVISEFYINPPSSDNNLEWVELKATKNIDFSLTPYTVVVNNNGTATANGWIAGGTISYGFQISTGTVTAGDVVFVGGNGMVVTGTKIRIIDVTTTPGDGFGNAGGTAGVFGNGGGNADGIAVFNVPAASITNSTVPVDAVFYGTAIGSAFVTTTTGYELPVNDLYSGGKLQTTSFVTGDPGASTGKATGTYNTLTNSWSTGRTWTTQTFVDDNASSISLSTAPPAAGTASIALNTQTVTESAGTATVNVSFASANASPAKVIVETSVYSNATPVSDYSWTNDTLTIPANSNGIFPFTINILEDLIAERTERIIVKLRSVSNATIAAANFQIIYLKDNDYQAPTPNNELSLNLLSSFSNGPEGPTSNSAEIVAFDPTTDKLYIANSIGKKVDIVDFSNPATPILLNSISVVSYGNINSLTVHNGVVACAIENTDPQMNGSIVFLDQNGVLISQVPVGAMPDMITFNNDYTKVLVACEGEPKSDYTVDPEGSVGIIDITGGYPTLTAANVTMVNFQSFNGQEAALRSQGIRIFGPGSSAAQDFEPEYITLSEDNSTAYVSLQENNAMAVINIAAGTVSAIRPLGTMNYANGNNGLDASDQTAGVFISSVPVKGMFMPDALAHATIGGAEYIFSANEGDAREYTAITEVARLSATSLDASIPDQNILKNNQFLGRINVTNASGDTDNDGDIDDIHVFGTRSFSIWNAQTGALVFDSKDLIEQITANHPTLSGLFNASNSSGTAVSKNRSDDKGPEPEGVATAIINGNHYLFVSLERVGGVMLFNVDVPSAPVYVGYYNNRTVGANSGPDRGAEGIIIIKKEDSPTGHDIVILANEISSTLSIFDINTCVDLAGATITVPTDSICAGDQVTLTIPGNAQSTVQWLKDDQIISGETGNSLDVTLAGNYRVYISNTTLACADTTLAEAIHILALPSIAAGSDVTVCSGDTVNLSGTSSATVTWNNSVQDGVDFFPTATMDYIATATDAYGCEDSDTLTVLVNTLPTVNAGSDQTVCTGTSITFTASGAPNLAWNNGITNGTAFNATTAGSYIVTGTDAFGCVDMDTLTLTLNALPTVNAGSNQSVCTGTSITFTATGAPNLVWNNGITNGTAFNATIAGSYIVTGTDANGCVDLDTLTLTLFALPSINLGADMTVCANHFPVNLNGPGGFPGYSWSNGATTQNTTGAQAGAYILTVTNNNGCIDKDTVVIISDPCLGLAENDAFEYIMYPNPASSIVFVETNVMNSEAIVYSANGQVLFTQQNTSTTFTLNLADLADGIYWVKVLSTEGAVTKQLILKK
ncbi:choice-of-anchor I family protein [Fluviicola taffensis]|uniref:choice-of-anchor I family protein n=1 Tax=Fluviicola taffensis TaxID=191579 RepID=UPI003137ACF1